MGSEEGVLLFRLKVMSKLKQASAMEFRFQKTQASISGTGTPLVDPCAYSSAVFGDFVLLGYQDWSEDIG